MIKLMKVSPEKSFTHLLLSLIYLTLLAIPTQAQTGNEKILQAKANREVTTKLADLNSRDPQKRAFAITLLVSLADEARSYHDLALRPRVLARAADALWDVEQDAARTLFRRAWESAEKGDAEEVTIKTKDNPPPMVMALRRMSGHDLRSEILALIAQRDRALGEELLAKLKDENERAANNSGTNSNQKSSDSWSVSEAAAKRLQIAGSLLDKGEVERALEFATPALQQVNANSIGFLCALRKLAPEAADERFALLLAKAEFDSSSDANTASGLSSYAFTPGFYVTFSAEGGATWRRGESVSTSPPSLPLGLQKRFFQVAAGILLRPLPPPDQDFTSSGRVGKYMIVKRLLPLFEQFMPNTASALRAQLVALADDPQKKGMGDDSSLLVMGLRPDDSGGSTLEKMQDRLDHAKTSNERDTIYTDAAVALANQGDKRAQDVADKIDDSDLRVQVRQYVDFNFVQRAIKKKDGEEAARLTRAGQLTHTQRAWAYTQAARIVMTSERPRALELLGEAVSEARRIDGNDSERALTLIGVATQFVAADPVRAWETMGEAIKAANSVEEFTGEKGHITFPLATKRGIVFSSVGGEDFRLSGVLRSLSKDDLYRAIDLAKSFKGDAARATATLAIARAILEK